MNPKKSKSQKQTEDTFGFKWEKQETYKSHAFQKEWERCNWRHLSNEKNSKLS